MGINWAEDGLGSDFPGERIVTDGIDWTWAFVLYRTVPGYPDFVVSSTGRVWSRYKRSRWREIHLGQSGKAKHRAFKIYRHEEPWGDMVRVNRLVLQVFWGPGTASKPYACHYPNPDPDNNDFRNLRWASHRENMQDAQEHGTKKASKTNDAQRIEMIAMHRNGMMPRDIGKRFGLTGGQVWSAMAYYHRKEKRNASRKTG